MARSLLRFLHLLTLALFMAQASGVVELFEDEEACAATCPGEDEHGECPDDCASCMCCVHFQSFAAPVAPTLTLPVDDARRVVTPITAPESREPRGIKHVPKHALS